MHLRTCPSHLRFTPARHTAYPHLLLAQVDYRSLCARQEEALQAAPLRSLLPFT